ncbi:MAG: hypothetical protein AVDCRST_MAG89-5225, partial [uncultured Gemmatimonadetes bacterium]
PDWLDYRCADLVGFVPHVRGTPENGL